MFNYNKIINPSTGRKVNVTSKLGKQILKNYLNQLGGAKNPHTGKEWSSYKCKGLSMDECENMDNYMRCTWVEETEKRRAYCKKTQRASRKRGQKNWKKAQTKIKGRVELDLSNLRITIADAQELLRERAIDPYSEEGRYYVSELIVLRYDPNYISQFTGKLLNKFTVPEPEYILWWQAGDKLDARIKYGDDILTEEERENYWVEPEDDEE